MTREALLVFCLRCGDFYDMDFEEGWSDHHTTRDGRECAPDPAMCTWVQDRVGKYCSADHTADWHVVTIEVEDD